MALITLNTRYCAFRLVPSSKIWFLGFLLGHRKSTNVDAIDSFISELMENKSFKWKVLNDKHKPSIVPKATTNFSSTKSASSRLSQIFDDLTSNPIVINIELLEQTHIDNLVDAAIKEENDKDVYLLFDQMLQYEKLPSSYVLNMLLEYFANSSDRNRLEKLVELCHKVNPKFVAENCSLLHYKAVLLWKSGNLLNSLALFKEVLPGCTPDAKSRIDRLMINIVDETIGKKSEAVLLAVIEMGEFCLDELGDSFLLCYVWQKSFQSPWYSDQEAAKAMFDKHESLRLAIAKRINSLCFGFMQEFNTEPVYRLMELFLKFEMLPQCRLILICLFEYQYWRRNLRACSEIIQNSIDLDIALPEAYNRKLLDLLLGRAGMQTRPPAEAEGKRKQKLQPKKYDLKF